MLTHRLVSHIIKRSSTTVLDICFDTLSNYLMHAAICLTGFSLKMNRLSTAVRSASHPLLSSVRWKSSRCHWCSVDNELVLVL